MAKAEVSVEDSAQPGYRLGTRGSALARTQSGQVAEQLSAIGGFPVGLVTIRTDGDILTGPLSQLAREHSTGVFVTALRDALSSGEVDLAVHSLKDLPTAAAPGLQIAAIPPRADSRDALCCAPGPDGTTPSGLAELPEGATVGTGSPRRAAQLRALRPDLEIVDIRGNIDTRLGRLSPEAEKPLDAVVLAAAGLERIGRTEAVTEFFEPDTMLPAPGQGALAVEISQEPGVPADLQSALMALDDTDTRLAVTAERALLARLEAGCSAPVGALGCRQGSTLRLEACVVSVDGSTSIRMARATDGLTEVGATLLGIELAEAMLADGAAELL
ncbi:hydroxymethylbilane synthase [Acaricomes phytoseiuli]|uniref:hydroxymethylbilane synthase n=1 Tax=Acaricomes phytoseiuli TaxID=291968 RepID=UPI002222EB11|nr:hydroxymethylbilane synthase [Acaricomes phytoseiuli]MCW1249022.1 hydroxymethylbilane synthase [Acaricomes phytoseiuli]